MRRLETDDSGVMPTLELARLLIDRCAACQVARPEESVQVGMTALEVLSRITLDEDARFLRPRATCLVGNAYRLQRDFEEAERLFSQAASVSESSLDTATYLRGLALLRWEQGRTDEAVGLMTRAEYLFASEPSNREASNRESHATRQLLVLLHADLGEYEATTALFSSLGPSDPTARPWLSARTALTSAFCLATHAERADPPFRGTSSLFRERALAALAEGSSFLPFVREEDEVLRLYWLEARASARLGRDHDDESTLAALRDRFRSEGGPALDFLLISLDLLALRTTLGRDVQDLIDELEDIRVGEVQVVSLLSFPTRNLWSSVTAAGTRLRRLFRTAQLGEKPLPFA